MYRVITDSSNIENKDAILCMSNVRGQYVKEPHSLPFSFYFSSGSGVTHGPRVKPSFNPRKLKMSQAGTLKLCDDWEYVRGSEDAKVSSKDIKDMKAFFRKYLVLFCAVWDELLQDGTVAYFFTGQTSFDEMVQDLDFYEDYKDDLDKIHDVESLESYCRKNNLVNMYGN